MSNTRKPHVSPEFRLEAAQLVVDQGYSVREAASAMGVGLSTMDRWARQLRDDRNGGTGNGTPVSEEQRKIRKLEKRVKLLELEKDILKKASVVQ